MISNSKIAILSHADTDLSALLAAIRELPADFSRVIGIALQSVATPEQMDEIIKTTSDCSIVLVRCLGDPLKIPGFSRLQKSVSELGHHFLVLSGTGDLDPEMATLSSPPLHIVQDAEAYFHAGGALNLANLLRRLSDGLLLTAFGFEPPQVVPEHGIYHPHLREQNGLDGWKNLRKHKNCAGIIFYRAHWLSGNTDFVDDMVEELDRMGMDALPVFTSSLRTFSQENQFPVALQHFFENNELLIQVLINTTSFAMGQISPDGPTLAGWSVEALTSLNVPVLQAVTSVNSAGQWSESVRGLNALDTAMNVVLPEFDGRIMTVASSFKEPFTAESIRTARYVSRKDRVERLAGIAARFARLRTLANERKKIAFVFTNSSGKAAQIGNAVGLDSPASLLRLLQQMSDRGYHLKNLPETSDQLMHDLIDRCCYDTEHFGARQTEYALARVPLAQYRQWFAQLPSSLRDKMLKQWGDPADDLFCQQDCFTVAGLQYGNVLAMLQPPRGYGIDQNAIYHQPDLPPTHHYLATYKWISDSFMADAIVHMGKHGTLEWLPGKAVALSNECFPDALLGDLPLFYPFILNDPGEGSQAKRRAHAVIVDHLMPAMTNADTYGPLAELAQLVDEYYQAEMLDESRLPIIQQQIWQLVQKANLQYDLNEFIAAELDEHRQLHAEETKSQFAQASAPAEPVNGEQNLPEEFRTMDWLDVSHLIQEIDGYLCELGAAQIRNGLHTLGVCPKEDALVDTLLSLVRLPNAGVPGLQAELAKALGFNMATLLAHAGARVDQSEQLSLLERSLSKKFFSNADLIECIDQLSKAVLSSLYQRNFTPEDIPQVLREALPDGADFKDVAGLAQVLKFVCSELLPALHATTDEIDNLLNGLEGKYIPAGPSGAPTRGMAHILPTGRNFYAVDPHTLPSESAWQVGQHLATEVIERYKKETGDYPESVTISAWGTSAMRTHGDDIAEVLALMGVRPVWQKENRRVTGVELVSLEELKRPRVDVTVRISGFFRDAFPAAIDLINQAVSLVVAADEPLTENFLRKHYLSECARHQETGQSREESERRSLYRVFGSKPGTYGAGILALIQEKNWNSTEDFAQAYVNWGGYAYAPGEYGIDMRDQFKLRLGTTQVAIHNQDNREHDIFDSDDYMQFHGGLIATIRSINGRNPKRYFGNSHNPSRPEVRDLKEEVLRVYRSRVINPKWIESIQKHGYKGALELAATVDYIFGYDATSDVMDDWMYEQLAESYVLDKQMQEFLEASNPWALHNMSERLLEAAQRGLWENPDQQTIKRLKDMFLRCDELLEQRQEDRSGAPL